MERKSKTDAMSPKRLKFLRLMLDPKCSSSRMDILDPHRNAFRMDMLLPSIVGFMYTE